MLHGLIEIERLLMVQLVADQIQIMKIDRRRFRRPNFLPGRRRVDWLLPDVILDRARWF
jgi:hypothetical protein